MLTISRALEWLGKFDHDSGPCVRGPKLADVFSVK